MPDFRKLNLNITSWLPQAIEALTSALTRSRTSLTPTRTISSFPLCAVAVDLRDSGAVEIVDPRLKAEKLLTEVLPEPLYLSLAATGEFHYQSPLYLYTFSRKKNTLLENCEGTWSACIHPEDTSIPRSDRIVAEYLLAKSDEGQYLKIANLTKIDSPAMPGFYFAREGGRIGDTINIRRPPPYRMDALFGHALLRPEAAVAIQPRRNRVSAAIIGAELLRLLCQQPPLNRPYPEPEEFHFERPGQRLIHIETGAEFMERDTALTAVQFSERVLMPVATRLSTLAYAVPFLVGFARIPLPDREDCGQVRVDGKSVNFSIEYDVRTDRSRFRARMACISLQ